MNTIIVGKAYRAKNGLVVTATSEVRKEWENIKGKIYEAGTFDGVVIEGVEESWSKGTYRRDWASERFILIED
jgi:hypothetical protein